jgi:hypothetical protein
MQASAYTIALCALIAQPYQQVYLFLYQGNNPL